MKQKHKNNFRKLLMHMKHLRILKKEKFMINMVKRGLNKRSSNRILDKDLVDFQEVETFISILVEVVEASMISSRNSLEEEAVEAVRILVEAILVEETLMAVLMVSNRNKRKLTYSMKQKQNLLEWVIYRDFIEGKKFG